MLNRNARRNSILPLVFVGFFNYCGDPILQTIGGDELPSANSQLSILSATATAQNLVELTFSKDLTLGTALNPENYVILGGNGGSLDVVGVVEGESADTVLVTTAWQDPAVSYILKAFRVFSNDNSSLPATGTSIEFSGYDPAAIEIDLEINLPTILTEGIQFTATVTAKRRADNLAATDFNRNVDWSSSAGGTFTIVDDTGWLSGSNTYTLVYTNPDLDSSGKLVSVITAADEDNDNIDGRTPSIQIFGAIELAYFQVDAPINVTSGTAFNITVTAIGTNGLTLTNYISSTGLTVSQGNGTMTPSSILSFTDGVATASVTYDGAPGSIVIKATDNIETTKFGVSDAINAGVGSGGDGLLNLRAVPFSANSIRLYWNIPVGTINVQVHRRLGAGSFAQIQNYGASTETLEDTGLAAGSYEYRVEAYNASSELLASALVSATPAACTNITGGAATITTFTTYDEVGGPYCIQSNININASGTLKIEPGAVLLFDAGIGIEVNSGGTLIAIGDATDPVIMTSSAASPTEGDWAGIDFESGSIESDLDSAPNFGDYLETGSAFHYTTIEFATTAIDGTPGNVELSIENCLFRENSGTAVQADDIAIVRSSIFLNNATGGSFDDSAYISNSIFTNHDARAIVTDDNTLQVVDSVFVKNSSGSFGGAIYNDKSDSDTTLITGSTFIENNAQFQGGAIGMGGSFDPNVTIRDSVFINNTSDNGGAIELDQDLIVEDSTFIDNIAADAGGAIFTTGGIYRDNVFVNNDADNGGAIYDTGSSTMENNYFEDNSANSTENGGAVYASRAVLSNNTFIDNFAGNGGAVYLVNGSATSSLNKNYITANDAALLGGGLYIAGPFTDTSDTNSIFSNTATTNGDNIYFISASNLDLFKGYYGATYVDIATAGIVEGSTGVFNAGTGGDAPVDTAWPLCTVEPTNSDCVGVDFVYP